MRRRNEQRPRVSVIIPTLNEEATIAAAIKSASGRRTQVVVVDGGSTDRTMDLAAESGANVIRARRGRARQMNAGAAVANGEILLFLHADTTLPVGFDEAVCRTLERPDVCICAFRLAIEAEGWAFRLIEKLVNFRSRVFQMPYGDQAISIRARVFHDIGGFPDMPVMEDYALISGLRRTGLIAVTSLPVVTSARRWVLRGIWRTMLINQACIAAYLLGVPPRRIARWRGDPGGSRHQNKYDDVVKSECHRRTAYVVRAPGSRRENHLSTCEQAMRAAPTHKPMFGRPVEDSAMCEE